jgi:L-amino acid N-acyltransferase YncA
VIVRPALAGDAQAMCDVINPIIAAGGTTAHRHPFDAERMRAHYIAPPRAISCLVALEAGAVLGFQALEWSDPDWPGEAPLPADWAVVASFVARGAQGRGVGKALFAATLAAARKAGVTAIDATIRPENAGGLAYYAAMGFRDYATRGGSVARRFDVTPVSGAGV